ncbi:MAG: aldehyde ferredoxin oxidoreductase family protein [Candidatus Lambdaproteobacteria bacterium]|nr:aldehyde ferredoxin oxidoreductase family protein [Candidatus Lambdaproteobacteria bacterium]
MAMHGFHGRYLRVDLTRGVMEEVPLAPEVLTRYLGGTGLGCWLLLAETRGAYDPLAPEAPLVLASAPLVGTGLNTSAKAAVLCLSPLTGRLNDAMISSHIALALRGLRADALVLVGAAPEWCVLRVEPEGASLHPAAEWRGLSAEATESALRARFGDDHEVAAIGPAGENGVPFATLTHAGRHAGRGGTGTVLGSKRLKALAVRGRPEVRPAHPARFEAIRRRLQARSMGAATEKYRTTGTIGNLLVFNRLEVLPTRNFQATSHALAADLSAETLLATRAVHRSTCADCKIGCDRRVELEGGGQVRLEYESLFALGPLLDLHDPAVVLEASRRCDALGLDTISTGGTLAFAMECAERGLARFGDLRFGNGPAVLDAVERIARREGEGALLALGTRALAARIGQGSEAFAAHVKGLEMPGYHPRGLQSLGIGLAVGSRGADHNRSGAYELDLTGAVDRFRVDTERIPLLIERENQGAVMDSLILCRFIRRAVRDLYAEAAEMLTALTGHPFTAEEIARTAEGIQRLKKRFNQRQGWSEAEDTLPARFFRGPDGAADGPEGGGRAGIDRERFRQARAEYYRLRGWDAEGRLPPEPGASAAMPPAARSQPAQRSVPLGWGR